MTKKQMYYRVIVKMAETVHDFTKNEMVKALEDMGVTYAQDAVNDYYKDDIGPKWFSAIEWCKQYA